MTKSERMYREMMACEAARARWARRQRLGRVLWAVGAVALAVGMVVLVAWRVRDPGWQASAARQLGMALAWGED